MSVDPVGLSGAAVNALIDAELNALAADAQALQGQLQPGDVVQAQVLPSNGLTDLVMINGNRVAAALPPSLRPGDVIQVQVTAFDGSRILLQMLEAEATPPAGGSATPTPEGSAATPLPPGTAAAPAGTTLAASPGALAPGRGGVAPTAIFMAVAARAGEALPAPPPAPLAGAPSNVILPPPAKLSAVLFPLVTGAQPSSIEARLAAARTGLPPPSPPLSGAPPATPQVVMRTVAPPGPPPANAPLPPAAQPPPATAAPARSFVAPPPIAAAPRSAVPPQRTPPATTAAAATSSAPTAMGLAAYRDPVVLVRALRLPVTPTTVGAAKLALESPQRLPNALATLEAALPNGDDPRVATLRAVAAFVGRIDPQSPELASQLASYVEHVVDGAEPKLVDALVAQTVAQQPAAAASEPALPVVALADAAVRALALVHDLKSALFSILTTPPAAGGEELTATAASALTAVTGVQLNAANALAANSQQLTFAIPLWTGGSYQQAQLTVDRDAPDRRGTGLDGDNFHIAFILDTKHLGTVAIDLHTVGRAVNVSVKTQALPAAERFADALSRLTDRLTKLRYRVASTDAQVARPTGTTVIGTQPVIPEDPPESLLDSRA